MNFFNWCLRFLSSFGHLRFSESVQYKEYLNHRKQRVLWTKFSWELLIEKTENSVLSKNFSLPTIFRRLSSASERSFNPKSSSGRKFDQQVEFVFQALQRMKIKDRCSKNNCSTNSIRTILKLPQESACGWLFRWREKEKRASISLTCSSKRL